MEDVCVEKTCREQAPIFAAESKRATIYAQRPQIDARNEIGNVCHDADGHQQGRSRISPKTSHGHSSASASRCYSGATIAQNRCDSFFIHSKGCTAFQAARHRIQNNSPSRYHEAMHKPDGRLRRALQTLREIVRILVWNLLYLPAASRSALIHASL